MSLSQRLLSATLAGFMLLSATSCSNSTNTKSEPDKTSSASGTSKSDAGKSPEKEMGGKVTVSLFDRGTKGQTQVDDNYWSHWIQDGVKKDLGIDVEFVPIIRSEEVTKLNVLMASSSAPDICMTYNLGLVSRFVEQGGLFELDDLVAQYGTNLNTVLGDEVLKYGRWSGKLYSVPARRNFVSHTSHWIRKDWLDKLQMPIPKTTDEWYQTMVAFKEKNPGKVDKVIPIACGSGAGLGNLVTTFTNYDALTEEQFYTFHELQLPGTKDYYRFMNKLNAEGLLSPDFALRKDDKDRDAEIMNGNAGFMSAGGVTDYPLRNQPGLVRNLWQNVEGAELVPCDPFTNPETGKRTKIIYPLYGIFTFVPSYSKHAREAIQYLDWTSSYDAIKFLQFGEEGVQHKINADGVPVLIDLDNERKQNSPSNSDYTLTQNGVNLFGDSELNRKAWVLGFGQEYAQLAEDCYMIGLQDGLTPSYFDRTLEKDAKYTTALEDKMKALRNKVITAPPADFDKIYDELVADYMASGGKEVYEEKVEVYKLMKAGK